MFLKKKRKNLYGNSCYSTQLSKSQRITSKIQDKSLNEKQVFGKQDINIQNKENAKLQKLNLNQKNPKNFKIKKQKQSHRLKENQNKNAFIETQMVSFPNFNEKTRKIELKKILDFHQTLKRTYAKRKTLSKAFQNWDIEKKGYLDCNDLKRIGERFNMRLSTKEIELLFVLSTGSTEKKLKPSQFISLIADQQFNDIDLKIDTHNKNLPQIFIQKFQQMKQDQQENKFLEYFQFQKHKIVKILNNKNLCPHKNYQMNEQEFKNALNSLNIDRKFLTEENKNYLFNANQKNSKVNFLNFVNKIYEFSSKHNYFRCEDDKIKLFEKIKKKDLIVDPRSLTLNKIEFLFKNLYKIRGRMKTKKLNQQKFRQTIEKYSEPLTKSNLQKFLKNIFDQNKINFQKEEINVIIRGFNFDENKIYNKEDLTETLFNTNMEDFIYNQRKRVFPEIEYVPQEKPATVSSFRMQQIQKDLDEKFFIQNKTQYAVYKALDDNKDNKISDKEFENYLTQNQICNKGEALALLEKLNIKENAYLHFNEFMKALNDNQIQAYQMNECNQPFNTAENQQQNISKQILKVKNLDSYYEDLKDQRRVKNLQNNCKLISLQLQRQIQIHSRIQKYFWYNKALLKYFNVLKSKRKI